MDQIEQKVLHLILKSSVGLTEFEFPLYKFQQSKIPSDEAKNALISLTNKDIIHAFITPTVAHTKYPRELGTPVYINKNPNIFENTEGKIKIRINKNKIDTIDLGKKVQESKKTTKRGGSKPKFITEDSIGFVVYENLKSNPLKNQNSRQFRLARQLCDNFQTAITSEQTYINIKLKLDGKRYSNLNDPYQRKRRIHKIIENTIGEIQRNFAGSGLNESFIIHHTEEKVWMEIVS